jgi:hypothetical protein
MLDGLGDQLLGLRQLAGLIGEQTEPMQRGGMPGIGGKDLLIVVGGLGETLGLVVELGLLKQRSNSGRVARPLPLVLASAIGPIQGNPPQTNSRLGQMPG